MTVQLAPEPKLQFFNNQGGFLAGGQLLSFAAGTSNPQATYTDSTQTTVNPNPVILNARGEASVWFNTAFSYKLVLQDQIGNQIWTQDNIPGGSITLAQLTQALIGSILYPQTQAEIAANVTPTNYAYPTLYIERYGGGVSASANLNSAALGFAFSVITQQGGGTVYMLGAGTYAFTSTFILPQYCTLQGGGYATILSYTGTPSTFLTLASTSGRCQIRDCLINGPGATGAALGVALGDAVGFQVGWCSLYRVRISGFGTGLKIGGATWFRAYQSEFTSNGIGMDINYWNANCYSSMLTFDECLWSTNLYNGIKATSVLLTMNAVQLYNCTVQNNCASATSNPQMQLTTASGGLIGFTIKGLYMEGATGIDAFWIDGCGSGSISDFYINGCSYGIRDKTGGSISDIDIENGIIAATTGAIYAASESNVIARNISGATAANVTLTGSGCTFLPSGSGMASWPNNEVVFTPAIAFGTSGSITQAIEAATYSQTGNIVSVNFRINWSASSSPSGTVTVTGLPVAPKASGPDFVLAVYCSGITIASGYVALFLGNGSTTATLYNVQTTTAAVIGSAFASTGSLVVSGSYQV